MTTMSETTRVDTSIVRFVGRCTGLDAHSESLLFDRSGALDGQGDEVRAVVASTIQRVRRDGDVALRALAAQFDSASLGDLEVPRERWAEALDSIDGDVRRAIERASRNIERVHRAFTPQPMTTESEAGIVIERRPHPLGRVGVYAPGGRAAYPSSVLMGVVPARVAGVGEVIVCSPPVAGTTLPSPVVLAAALIGGADRVFAVGGAGAIAAMAYGTESLPRVDRIVGPGNAYVAEAKTQVASVVGIDSPAGPSELLVLCDGGADASLVAREMLAQAEHDPMAVVIAVALGEADAVRIVAAIREQLPSQPRAAIARAALAARGAVLWAADIDEAAAFANRHAPEHLLLLVADTGDVVPRLRNAGTVFVGPSSSVAFGDYMTGANHVLPTGGMARLHSGLSTSDFVRWTTYQYVTPEAAGRLAEDVGVFADAEGLGGHAMAARAWASPVRAVHT